MSATHYLAPDVGAVQSSLRGGPLAPHSRHRQPGSIGNSQLVPSFFGRFMRTGRPQKTEDKRTKKIDARFTEEEFRLVFELEKTLGVRRTDLVRTRLLQDAQLTIINAKELIAELEKIGTELGRSGNNINQLARYANRLNKKGILSPQVVEQFNLLFASHLEIRQGLETSLRKIIRALGR